MLERVTGRTLSGNCATPTPNDIVGDVKSNVAPAWGRFGGLTPYPFQLDVEGLV